MHDPLDSRIPLVIKAWLNKVQSGFGETQCEDSQNPYRIKVLLASEALSKKVGLPSNSDC